MNSKEKEKFRKHMNEFSRERLVGRMTLDEAIKHAEEVAEENQRVVDTGIVFDDVTIDMLYCDDTEVIEEHLANYQRCADEHRQLADWLKELKQLREQTQWIPVSEKMPQEREWIGTKQFGTTISDEVYVTFETPKGDRFTKHLSFQNGKLSVANQHMINAFYKGSVPVAWMPLPEPYKAESEMRE